MSDLERSLGDDGGGSTGGIFAKVSSWNNSYRRRFQIFADRVTPYVKSRWAAFTGLMFLFGLRIFLAEGFYIVAYALAIYQLNILVHFLTPKSDPEDGAPILPQGGDEDFRPFERKLPEFKFWWNCVRATIIAFFVSLFKAFDVPVYWPILVIYFIILFVLTMKKEITKWIQLGYVPWNRSKPSYA